MKFENNVVDLKNQIYKEIAKAAYGDNFLQDINKIPSIISPGPKPLYRKTLDYERNIVKQRVDLIVKSDLNKNLIQIIKPACDKCLDNGYNVTNACRGCISHPCRIVCPKQAISVDENNRSVIDKTKCINCGLCAKACPYGAIFKFERPCKKACAIKAMDKDENGVAKINDEKCVRCASCVAACPFSAIVDQSQMVDVINLLKTNKDSRTNKVYAIVAPAIGSQYRGINLQKIATGLIQLGFDEVYEAALGADMTTELETKELYEKKFLFSSCCPAFVKYIKIYHPEVAANISHNLSPMAQMGKALSEKQKNITCVFIGPCVAKKMEVSYPEVAKYVKYALTFFEMNAMFEAKNIDLASLAETNISLGSSFGRCFAKCGGLSSAVAEFLKENNMSDFKLNGVYCNGLAECVKNVNDVANKKSPFNFIEGMACSGGCTGGPCSLNHSIANKALIDLFAKSSKSKTINESLEGLKNSGTKNN